MKTRVVNLRRSEHDVYIGRGSMFGNQFVIGKHGDRANVIQRYKEWFYAKLNDIKFKQAVIELKGKRLGCYCKPLPCHGDIIVEYLEDNDV